MERIMTNRLDRGFFQYQKDYEDKAIEVLRSGWYILGQELENFEREFAQYIGTGYCVGLASGLDALWIAFRALGIGEGDEVIVQGNTYIASVMGITLNGATPVFVEPDEYYNMDSSKIEEKITDKTKAILVVHLYGQASNMGNIRAICDKHGLKLVEDCAQSHYAEFNGKKVGTFGILGFFSFYPTKNIGAFGDGGAVVTDDEKLYQKIKMLRNYGSSIRYDFELENGHNSRLDEIQAALLRIKIKHAEEITNEKTSIANRYLTGIKNPLVELPKVDKGCESVWHLFVLKIEDREAFIKHMNEKGVQTDIHYPIPPHLSKCYKYLNHHVGEYAKAEYLAKHVVDLPIFNGMTDEEVESVIEAVNSYGK